MPPKSNHSLDNKNHEHPNEEREESANNTPSTSMKKARRESRIPPNHASTKLPAEPSRPLPQRRASSRLSQYDHIGPKVDSNLDPKFIPRESQFQRPKHHKRSSLFISSEPYAHESNVNFEDDETLINEDGSTLRDTTPNHTPPHSSAGSSMDRVDTSDYFGGSRPIAGPKSPSYHSDSEASSTHRSVPNSQPSSRKHSLEHPTSNPAAYAKGTKSYKKKINEKVDYVPYAAPSSPSPKIPPPLIWRKSSLEVDGGQVGAQRTIKFEKPNKPEMEPRPGFQKHERKRARSLLSIPRLESNYVDNLRDEAQVEVLKGEYRALEGQRDRLVNELREREEGLKRAADMIKEKEVRERELKGTLERQTEKIKELEMALRTSSEEKEQERDNEHTCERQEGKIGELEEALRTSNEQLQQEKASQTAGEQGRKQLEEMSKFANKLSEIHTQEIKQLEQVTQTNELQAQQLVEASEIIEVQAQHIKQLEEALQAKPIDNAHATQLQEAHRTNDQQAQKIKHLEEALQEKQVHHAVATGTDTPEWHDVYLRQKKIAASQEHEIEHLRTSVKQLDAYLPDLEHEVHALRKYVTVHRDTVKSLQDQLAVSTKHVEQWRNEYEQQKDMLEKRAVAEETALQELRDEMHSAILAYQALMPSKDHPDALEVTGLARKIDSQQKALKEITQLLENVKEEKRLLEKGVEKLLDEKKELVKENEELRLGPLPPPRIIIDEETKQELRLPRWNTADLIKKRELAMTEFRQKQTAARETKEAEERLVEKARGWKMGRWYPPLRTNYEEAQKKSERERWEVKTWAEREATDGEYDEAKRLGLLEEQKEKKKGRGEVDWMRMGWRGMGLRSWDE